MRMLTGSGIGKYTVVGKAYRYLAKEILPEYILIEDNKIFLDSEDAITLALKFDNFVHEPYEMSLFKSVLKTGDVVVDIGANVGVYTLTAAKYAEKVYSFEPDPESIKNLKRNIQGNFYDNIVTVNKAVSDRSGKAEFSSPSSKTGRTGNRLLKSKIHAHESITVDTISLDDFFTTVTNKIDVVKIDTNGAEFQVLRGMKNIIERNKNIKLFLEFYPFGFNLLGEDISAFLEYLDSLSLSTYHINEDTKNRQPVSKDWLLNFAKGSGKDWINLLCSRDMNLRA